MSPEPELRMIGEAESDRTYAVGVVLGPDGVHRLKVLRMGDKVQVYCTAASWGLEESMARAAAAMLADVRTTQANA
jgi:hypothetical protein